MPTGPADRGWADGALAAYLERLRDAGARWAVSPRLVRDPDHRGPLAAAAPNPRRWWLGPGLSVTEEIDPERGVGADHATVAVGRALAALGDDLPGSRVVDLGCGSGVLGIAAATLGAAAVIATDVDPAALALAGRNAAANGVALELREGSLCEPLGDTPVDLFLANLPHKPSCGRAGLPLSQDGGPDGDALWAEALPGMARRQRPGGRLLFSLHSLAHPRLLAAVQRCYALELLRWKLRWLSPDGYRSLRECFRQRHRAGTSYLVAAAGEEAFVTCVWLCTRREAPCGP